MASKSGPDEALSPLSLDFPLHKMGARLAVHGCEHQSRAPWRPAEGRTSCLGRRAPGGAHACSLGTQDGTGDPERGRVPVSWRDQGGLASGLVCLDPGHCGSGPRRGMSPTPAPEKGNKTAVPSGEEDLGTGGCGDRDTELGARGGTGPAAGTPRPCWLWGCALVCETCCCACSALGKGLHLQVQVHG